MRSLLSLSDRVLHLFSWCCCLPFYQPYEGKLYAKRRERPKTKDRKMKIEQDLAVAFPHSLSIHPLVLSSPFSSSRFSPTWRLLAPILVNTEDCQIYKRFRNHLHGLIPLSRAFPPHPQELIATRRCFLPPDPPSLLRFLAPSRLASPTADDRPPCPILSLALGA